MTVAVTHGWCVVLSLSGILSLCHLKSLSHVTSLHHVSLQLHLFVLVSLELSNDSLESF